ncbi:Lysophospholipase L1 [Amycolatopsis xylanica]|uniref:Lysophospholipase L1 n=1 Tax=Amycolatopsis xylanica TaxID=589385 RepID=A0A1H3PCK8_9PSEU|nr:SGNH/GDSL hydrolase family protein [Amycolatopsis xylanica]SDY98129.1 Lysophospholipase L1 [Amycolatopsis xylanica]
MSSVAAAVLISAGVAATASPDAPPPDTWVATWGTANNGALPDDCAGCSIRNLVHTSAGGSSVRVRLSNVFSPKPVTMSHVTVAVAAGAKTPEAVQGSLRSLTFGGAAAITLSPGSEVLSDPVALAVPADGNLLVTTFTPTPSGPITYHRSALQTSFIARTGGDHAAEEAPGAYTETTGFTHYLADVEVRTNSARGTVVAFGDSITSGSGSTSGTNQRWPDILADRLLTQPASRRLSVVNAGIPGNALLTDSPATGGVNALARLDRDVFAKSGIRTVIIALGINDAKTDAATPALISSALQQIAAQAHARGIRVVIGTLGPFKGWHSYTEAYERNRVAVNKFIRDSKVFDAVVDFDAALRDPADPLTLRPEYDSGDHLHPNNAGYKVMGSAVDLSVL